MMVRTVGASRREGRKLGSGPSVTYNRPFRSVDKILCSRGVPILPVSSGSSNSQIQKQQLPRRIFGSMYPPFTRIATHTLALSLLCLAFGQAATLCAHAQQEAPAQAAPGTTPETIAEI